MKLTTKHYHRCADNTVYDWVPRVPNPRNCPRCKAPIKEKITDAAKISANQKEKS